jgi:uncharacterized protein YbjT (DUF2867 family)
VNRYSRANPVFAFLRILLSTAKAQRSFNPVVQEKYFVFVTGGTGFMGRKLITSLLERGHRVKALVREGSQQRLPPGAEAVIGDPLSAASIAPHVTPAHTFVQLVGVAHPNPSKANEFRAIDQTAGCAGAEVAGLCRVTHFVYVSVAQPAPVMKAYIMARSAVEARIYQLRLDATILRPWYVLGPGRRWPILLKPFYALLSLFPQARASANRLGLVTCEQMIAALVNAIENPSQGMRIVEVPQIRQSVLG